MEKWFPLALHFRFSEPHNAISETDWQKLWQNAENSAIHKQDPNGSEVTDPPGLEETEVSNQCAVCSGTGRFVGPIEFEEPSRSRSIECMPKAIIAKLHCIINGHRLPLHWHQQLASQSPIHPLSQFIGQEQQQKSCPCKQCAHNLQNPCLFH